VSSAFNTNCVPNATVLDGSCTAASFYWSSTPNAFGSGLGRVVGFIDGGMVAGGKGSVLLVRAVRDGS
jgi:hypothetical protein